MALSPHSSTHPEVPFTVVSDMQDGHLALGLIGELDLACTDMLVLDGHDDDMSILNVTVDMADLEFIDTAGVRALIEVKTRHSERGREVHLVNSVHLVRKVVSLYGRSDLLVG